LTSRATTAIALLRWFVLAMLRPAPTASQTDWRPGDRAPFARPQRLTPSLQCIAPASRQMTSHGLLGQMRCAHSARTQLIVYRIIRGPIVFAAPAAAMIMPIRTAPTYPDVAPHPDRRRRAPRAYVGCQRSSRRPLVIRGQCPGVRSNAFRPMSRSSHPSD
jgi:hypothetical protein